MRLSKHHALGNDFLIVLDKDGRHPIDSEVARSVCDRHRGVGADGLIRVSRGSSLPFRMELHNEDGSRAEMSGNGISCLAQAVFMAGYAQGGVLDVETDAGPRRVTVADVLGTSRHRMRVAMGTPRLTAELSEWETAGVLRAVQVEVGNPHVVCHVPDPALGPDLVEIGEKINASTPGGTNVELVTPGDAPGEIVMSVFERGVGPTEACGTGAVAAAAAAHEWGLAPRSVRVRQPGGTADVDLGEPAHLAVPVVAIASLEWPL